MANLAMRLALGGVELSSEGTRNSQAGVGVGEELGGVLLDLLDGETLTRVLAVGHNTSSEGALETANAASAGLVADRVGESDSRLTVSFTGPCIILSRSVSFTYLGGPDLPFSASWI